MPFVTAINQAALDHIFQKAAWTQPGNIEIALSTSAPNPDGTGGTEPAAASYSRITTLPADWTRTGNDMQNNARKDFPEAAESWGTITHIVLFDASSGNPIAFGALPSSQSVASGQQPYFDANDITVRYV